MKRNLFSHFILILIIFGGGVYVLSSSSFQKSYGTEQITLPPLQNGFNSSKVIIIAFDDSSRTQFTLAKPVLDKYGFKGSFFTVCTYVNQGSAGKDKSRMTWQDIK